MNDEMKKKVISNLCLRNNKAYCVHNKDDICVKCREKISGDVSEISGNVSGIYGDVSRISGEVSAIYGDVSRIYGNVSGISGDVSRISGDVEDIIEVLRMRLQMILGREK